MKLNNATTPILEVKNLRKVFKHDIFKKNQIAVKDLSCRFLRNKCTGLLGHNGAGKTTTIRIIFGLVYPTSGEVLFNGKPITIADKSRIGYMPENNKIPDNLNSIEILRHHLGTYCPNFSRAKKEALIEESLRKVGMWDVRGKRIRKLSKGMGRRLAWAQATIHKPDLVILDEPFSGLDPVARFDLLEQIKSIRSQGTSLVLCTHELWSIRELCDEVHIFKKGELAYSTLDAAKTQRSAQLNRSNYQLAVSGVKEESLRDLGAKHGLKPWEYASQKDLVCRMTFKDYESGCAWLKLCLDKGIIVLRFADEIAVEDETIKVLFEGGQLE